MIELDEDNGDSHEFLQIASRLISGAAIASDLPVQYGLWVARVDGFFGRTWLGFRGKLFGQVGVHNRSLKDDLAFPPFHTDRVLSVRYFVRDEHNELVRTEPPFSRSLSRISSTDNVNGKIHLKGVCAWYSTESETTSKGAVMVYAIKDGPNAAWYTTWENKPPWKLVQNIGIAPRTCRHFINLGTHPNEI
ncbi:MAG: hypothetical protein O3A00_10520 [Planctomycetota bacterium]|nr:hypothetical protein [Planctomycetota bacterium]